MTSLPPGSEDTAIAGARAASGEDPTLAAGSAGGSGAETAAAAVGAARYALGRELGRGGMGAVFEADDLQFRRKVAIKRLLPDSARDAEERFAAEAMITGTLGHSGVPAVHERGRLPDGSPFYAMQKIEGRTFEEVLREVDDPAVRIGLLPILVRVAQTIGFAHERGVVHRDIKPDNVIVGRHGQVVVLDWGLAKVTGSSIDARPSGATPRAAAADLTIDGAVLGTPAYMAPEQAAGRRDAIDARTDVFGLGALLYRILTGRAPFTADSSLAALARASEGKYEPVQALNPAAPPALVALCDRALSRDPMKRPQTAAELADELEAFTRTAVSSAGVRVVDWISTIVGALSVAALAAVVLVVATTTGKLASLGPVGGVIVVLAILGCSASILEYASRGRYHLSPMAIAIAIGTGALGVGAWAQGMSEVHGIILEISDAAERETVLHAGNALALPALALGGFLSGLQMLAWGVARRRVAVLDRGMRAA